MIFIGSSELAIDEKNRLAIPSRFRNRLDPKVDGAGFVIVPGNPPTTLWLYTERHFEELAGQPESDLVPDDDQLHFDQSFFPQAEYLELDTQGRILIPERMRRRAELGKEVVICGVRDHLEIRRREDVDRDVGEDLQRSREFLQKQRKQTVYRGGSPAEWPAKS